MVKSTKVMKYKERLKKSDRLKKIMKIPLLNAVSDFRLDLETEKGYYWKNEESLPKSVVNSIIPILIAQFRKFYCGYVRCQH